MPNTTAARRLKFPPSDPPPAAPAPPLPAASAWAAKHLSTSELIAWRKAQQLRGAARAVAA